MNIQVITGDMTRVTEAIIKTATRAIMAEEGAGTEEEVIEDKLEINSSMMNNDIEFCAGAILPVTNNNLLIG